jgi:hypothetical protein
MNNMFPCIHCVDQSEKYHRLALVHGPLFYKHIIKPPWQSEGNETYDTALKKIHEDVFQQKICTSKYPLLGNCDQVVTHGHIVTALA